MDETKETTLNMQEIEANNNEVEIDLDQTEDKKTKKFSLKKLSKTSQDKPFPLKEEHSPVQVNKHALEMHKLEANGHPPTMTHTESESSNMGVQLARGPLSPVNNFINMMTDETTSFFKKHQYWTKMCAFAIFFGGFTAYLIAACMMDFDRAQNLFAVSIFGYFCFFYSLVKKYLGGTLWKNIGKPMQGFIKKYWRYFKWSAILIFVGLILFFIIYDVAKEPDRLISLVGLFVYVMIGFLFSSKRDRIKWRPVLWGFALQFIFGMLILRTKPGLVFFEWLGKRVDIFLNFTLAGSEFLFDKNHMRKHNFAFVVLPVVVFFSAFTYVIYYLGIIQVVIKKIAWLLQITMGTSPAESVNAAGNIFIGQTEAPLLIRPFLEDMTTSELHAIMTGGFATIAGSVLGAFISFGVSATHLLSASVMSAPAALAMSKLMYPETEEPKVANVEDIKIEKGTEKNVFEALAAGASMSIPLVANIACMLIAFMSMLRFCNVFLGWIGNNVGYDGLSFERICSYVLVPFAYVMGVEWKDSFAVAELLGTKTFLNEFIAYEELSKLIRNRRCDLEGVKLSVRSETIATYALCGFANIGAMGVQIGGISGICPSKRPVLAKLALRAMIAGTMACFMTACIAGVLYETDNNDYALGTAAFCNGTAI